MIISLVNQTQFKLSKLSPLFTNSINSFDGSQNKGFSFLNSWEGLFVPAFLFLFIASHAIGQGAVIWVFISEIFPNHLRAKGQAFGSSVHWVLAAIITLVMPSALKATPNPGFLFFFFAIMMVFQLLFVIKIMPETKGVPLEELGKKISRN